MKHKLHFVIVTVSWVGVGFMLDSAYRPLLVGVKEVKK